MASGRHPFGSEEPDLGDRRLVTPQRFAFSQRGMVATAHYEASQAAARILGAGGNAVDAAVAAAFALGVCEPAASGLGGQTFMLIRLRDPRRTFALDGSSRAPHRALVGRVSKAERARGYRATTVPSTPAVLDYARRRYGTMKLRQLLEPAIEIAERGVVVSALQRTLMKRERKHLIAGTAGPLFLIDGKRVPPAGSLLKQPVLAATLRHLAGKGTRDFYRGEIAQAIHEDMIRHDGLLRRDDLAQIPRPIERRTVSCSFEGWKVVTFPPPGAGRTLIEMLNILKNFPPRRCNPDTVEGALVLARVIKRAFIDRNDRPFDPNFYPQVKGKRMISDDYSRKLAREIRRSLEARGETTHLSVMDSRGNVVGLTQSIERVFGACVATPTLGFLYNNYLMAFEHEDISHPYYLRPNAVPWASVAPTIVFKQRRPWAVLGSPGSERIVSSLMQVLLRLRRHSPFEAVDAPRLHCSLEGKVSLEAPRMRGDIPDALRRAGFTIDPRDAYSFYLGCVQLVVREEGAFFGVADPRRDGSATGPIP